MSVSNFADGPGRRYDFGRHGHSSRWADYNYDRRQNGRPAHSEVVGGVGAVDGGFPTLARLAKPQNLLQVYDAISVTGGQAPGADGLRYGDLSRAEIADRLRRASRAIRAGTYRPDRPRIKVIPKGGGRTRELRLRGIIDRVISQAAYRALCPIIDPLLLDGVHGYRPRRSVHTLLSSMESTMISRDRWWIMTDDIRDAFPSVVIADVLADFGRHIIDPGLLDLIERILRGHDLHREVGIDQGDPLSPIALNLRVHHALGIPLNAACRGVTDWYLYADNLVVLSQSRNDCWSTIQHAGTLLRSASMELKGEMDEPVNLRRNGQRIKVLGFELRREGDRLRRDLGRGALENLKRKLARCWDRPDPVQCAREKIQGWIEAFRPAFIDAETRNRYRARITEMAAHIGLREGITDSTLEAWMTGIPARLAFS